MTPDQALEHPATRRSAAALQWALAATVLAVAYFAFSRPFWLSHGERLLGANDSLLNLFTMEQWYRWLFLSQGNWKGGWSFYPVANTLGLTDAMFLLSLPYSALRLAGVDLFTADEVTLYGTSAVGGIAFFLLLHRELRLPPLPSAIGVVPAAWSNATFLSIGHTQLFACAFVPILAILLVRGLRAMALGRASAFGYALAVSVLFPLLFFTGYYVAWFFLFMLLGMGGVALASRPARAFMAAAARGVRWPAAAACVALAALAFVPFFLAYLPVLRETGGRPFIHVFPSLPRWFDFVNVSLENAAWGAFIGRQFPDLYHGEMWWELMKGQPLVTVALFVACVPVVLRAAREPRVVAHASGGVPGDANLRAATVLAAICGGVVLLEWALMLRVGDSTAWRFVHTYVPGGSAIRAVFRFNLVLAYAIGLVIAVAITLAWRRAERKGWRAGTVLAATAALGAVLVAEQLNRAHGDALSRAEVLGTISSVPAAPPACKSFFVTTAKPGDDASDRRLSVRALLIAQARGVPTLNGYSGGSPAGWALNRPARPDYRYHVTNWVRAQGLRDGVCELDLDTRTWIARPVDAMPVLEPMTSALGPGDFRFEGSLQPPLDEMRAGESRTEIFTFRNLGTRTWTSTTMEPNGKYMVRFAYQWINASGVKSGFNNRWPILGAARPGETVGVEMGIIAPPDPGAYILEIDAVQEWVTFFSGEGNPPFRKQVVVK